MEDSLEVKISNKIEANKDYYNKLIKFVCDSQGYVDNQQRENMEKTVATITSLNILLNSISDKVFLKQLKATMLPTVEYKFNYGVDDIEQLMHSLKDDVDCINNSRIPLWLSSTVYFFNHNWRKQVYERITVTYFKIRDYLKIESEKYSAKINFEKSAYYKEAKEAVLTSFSTLLKEINDEIENAPITLN